jgi:uroporphyrin-3 C-methyltransferase
MIRTVTDANDHPTPAAPVAAPAHSAAPANGPDARDAQAVQPDLSEDEPSPQWVRWAVLIVSVVAAGSGWLAWTTEQRVRSLEQELVRRQQLSLTEVAEARMLAHQSDELSRQSAARAALIETRLNEVALQRSQVEDLVKNLSISRDENLVADIETGLRVAMQQASLTGSAEPMLLAMQSADERLAHAKQPRLDNVRRALARDLDRLRATRVADVNNLSIRLDEAVRLVDDLPLLNQPEATVAEGNKPAASPAASPATADAAADVAKSRPGVNKPGKAGKPHAPAAASAPTAGEPGWSDRLLGWTQSAASTVWNEARALVRITRVRQPEAMLLSPDQGFFLRENVKLRLLNARLALLSRQTSIAQADLQAVQASLPRYFQGDSRKTQLLVSMIDDVSAQAKLTTLPRPDDTLAALATVAGGR